MHSLVISESLNNQLIDLEEKYQFTVARANGLVMKKTGRITLEANFDIPHGILSSKPMMVPMMTTTVNGLSDLNAYSKCLDKEGKSDIVAKFIDLASGTDSYKVTKKMLNWLGKFEVGIIDEAKNILRDLARGIDLTLAKDYVIVNEFLNETTVGGVTMKQK